MSMTSVRVGRLGWWRVVALVTAVVLLPGLLALDPVVAEPGEATGKGGVPELSLPEQVPVIPVGAPSGVGTPMDTNPKKRSVDELPKALRELVERRSAKGEVWLNEDGSETAKLHLAPVHFQPAGSQAWERIDSSLAPDPERPGWVRNAANSWTVRFGPITGGGGGGVEVVTEAGRARVAPDTPAASVSVAPEVEEGEESDSVTYAEVWPGVDVVYRVSNTGVTQELVVDEGGRSEFPFVVEGLDLAVKRLGPVAGPEGANEALEATGVQAGTVSWSPATASADGGASTDGLPPVEQRVGGGAGAVQRLTVSAGAEWLTTYSAGEKKVRLASTIVLGVVRLRGEKVSPGHGLEDACEYPQAGVHGADR